MTKLRKMITEFMIKSQQMLFEKLMFIKNE